MYYNNKNTRKSLQHTNTKAKRNLSEFAKQRGGGGAYTYKIDNKVTVKNGVKLNLRKVKLKRRVAYDYA